MPTNVNTWVIMPPGGSNALTGDIRLSALPSTDSLRERIQELEKHLLAPERKSGAYRDLPFAIFRYDPEEEFEVRGEVEALAIRLERCGQHVSVMSLGQLMYEALEEALGPVGLEELFRAEAEHGVDRVIDTVHRVLTEIQPLSEIVYQQLITMDPQNSVLFLIHVGDLFPVMRPSALLESLIGRVVTPVVLFYPGKLEGAVGLRFMGVLEAEHSYRLKIY